MRIGEPKWTDEVRFRRDPRIQGECQRCGKCCILAKVLNYWGQYASLWPQDDHPFFERISPFHGRITCFTSCEWYDPVTKTCTTYNNRNKVCPGWPMFKNDLRKVNCVGFSWRNNGKS